MSRKLALIIGNNDYSNKPLKNCVNDATDLANVLRGVENCQVELRTNLRSDNMYDCINDFIESIRRNDFVIFFFAGHGIQWGDQNFLLPCDDNKTRSGDNMQRYAINAQSTVNRMSEMHPQIVLFLLDCCRLYWLPGMVLNRARDQQVGGLNPMKIPRQTLIAFACAAGEIVSDQFEGSNSGLFTKYLLKHITTPNEHIETILRRVANDVVTITDHSQIPFRVSSITSDEVYLVTKRSSKTQMNMQQKTTNPIRSKIFSSKVNSNNSSKQDINILLLGPTGVGRTTFINALANYLVNDKLKQAVNDNMQVLIPFSFSFTDSNTFIEKMISVGKSDEYENLGDNGHSCTQQCRSFVFPIGDRLLRLIDTPAVGDTRGIEQDMKNFDEIISYTAQYEYLNGICILLKSNEEKLTLPFLYCVQELLRHLPKSSIENILFVFTNARLVSFGTGDTSKQLRRVFKQHEEEYSVQIAFTKDNTFLIDNEPFRCLALRRNGIKLNNEQSVYYEKSWDNTVREYTRLIAYITTCPVRTVRDTVSLYEVQQLIRILIRAASELPLSENVNRRLGNTRDEEMKIENVYRKLCKFLLDNAILPWNKAILDYIKAWIREEQMKHHVGTQNIEVVKGLEMQYSNYENEINLLKKTLENENKATYKTELIQAEDIFPLVSTLYQLPINGRSIRKQVEELKTNQKRRKKREIFVKLPPKADWSELMVQLKECIS